MRPIEFRAKCTEEIHTHHEATEIGEWLYGYLVAPDCLRIKMSEESGGIGPGFVYVDVSVDPSTVGQLWIRGQYKFYGGDLFFAQASPSGSKHMRKMLCMVQDSDTGMEILVWHKKEWWGYGKLDLTNIERAGNKFDNPELIKP